MGVFMDLTIVQKEILQELIAIYREKNRPVKGTEIAIRLNRNPGTIRNQMQALRALNLVDGVPGPKGGYVPTSSAYRAVGLISGEEEISVPIYKGDERVEGVYVEKIVFDTVAHEKSCSSMIYIKGDTKIFNEGDIVKIGPTYHNKIIIFGKVSGRDDIDHILLIDVIGVTSIPNITVKSIAIKEDLIWLSPDTNIKDAAKIFYDNNINGAPIISNGNLVGILTLHDLAYALSNSLENESVEKIMAKNPLTITPDKKVYDALILMEKQGVGRLIVVDKDSKVIGIITRTDVLKLIEGALFPKILKELIDKKEL
ncbi:putative signal transduction protein with CBS domains [Methanothermococcus okinawensis IH1]|uniref:Signal transduction protein with CBS domains n=2 Tax=Methanothermococcus okinawensis TaxID=155863 RepID=F8ANZ1_METOI|nr:putative signal transduction protein with CBS domains [Methanothermococcus okinawensis IH1]